MFTYTTTYRDKEIKFTVGLWGKESLYVNDTLISVNNNWTFSSKHEFEIDGQTLLLRLDLNSVELGSYEVSIFEGEQLIFNEVQIYGYGLDGSGTSFSKEDWRWKSEIALPQDIISLAKVMYFLLFIASFIAESIGNEVAGHVSILLTAHIVVYGLYKIIKSSLLGLRKNTAEWRENELSSNA